MSKVTLFFLSGLFFGYSFMPEFGWNTYEVLNAENKVDSKISIINISSSIDTLQVDSAKTCVDCHDDYIQGEIVHSPVKKDCLRCHVSNGAEHPLEKTIGFNLKQSVPNLCYECHDPMEEEFIHDPVGEGDCIKCHDFHKSENLYLLKANPISSICYECHDLEIPEGNHIHGAVKDGNCAGCHSPHQADNKDFLANRKLDRLCKKCHKSIRKELKKEYVHEPFKNKKCFDCHNAHSSKEEHLSDLTAKELCLSCHDDVHLQLKETANIHGAIDEPESCLNCHSSHSSDKEKILKYENIEMCLRCHEESLKTSERTIEGIGSHLVEGNHIHGAITEEGCSTCHNSHVSEESNLMNSAFPVGVYVEATTDNFALCFRCHDKEMLSEKTTLTSTNFRDGDINLHFTHINGDKARNCNTCHDMHGAQNKYMIKENTTFGNWDMPIKFSLFSDGGSCLTGCHKEYKYVRVIQDTLLLSD